MNHLRILFSAVGFIAGIIAADYLPVQIHPFWIYFMSVTGLGFSAYFVILEKKWKNINRIFVVLSAFFFTFPAGYLRLSHFNKQTYVSPPQGSYLHAVKDFHEDDKIIISGEITAEPVYRSKGYVDFTIKVHTVKNLREGSASKTIAVKKGNIHLKGYISPKNRKPNRLQTQSQFTELTHPEAYGYKIKFASKFKGLRKVQNPGEFDHTRFLFENGLSGSLSTDLKNIQIIKKSAGNPVYEIALKAKVHFLRTFKSTIRPLSSRLLSGAVLGTRRALENINYKGTEIEYMFQRSGVGHILAVSGLHVSIITLLFLLLLSGMRIEPRIRSVIIIIILMIFALVTGARPSTIRAVIMNAAALTAMSFFRYPASRAFYIGISLAALFILIRNPFVLYSASFLLSFGAVLSIVMITKPLEKFMIRSARGFALLFLLIWFVFFIKAINTDISDFLKHLHVFLSLLTAAFIAGNVLNRFIPVLWRVGFEKIPGWFRSLITAQFSIQLGMMIPLNAWFFGQFPIAGIFVNLIAIPFIGIIVQLGIITGLLAMIPEIGLTLARPFGAAATVAGKFFFELTHQGAEMFHYPAVFKPSLYELVIYYTVLLTIIVIFSNFMKIKDYLYRLRKKHLYPYVLTVFFALPVFVFILPPLMKTESENTFKDMTIFHAGKYPLILMTSKKNKSCLINGGTSWIGSQVLFKALREKQIISVKKAFITGIHPDIGHGGISGLAQKLPIKDVWLPIYAGNGNLLKKSGDLYLLKQAKAERSFATSYNDTYQTLLNSHTNLHEISGYKTHKIFQDTFLTTIIPQKSKSSFLKSREFSVNLILNIDGVKWFIAADTLPEMIKRQSLKYDLESRIAVVPGDTFPFVKPQDGKTLYETYLDTIMSYVKPEILICVNDNYYDTFSYKSWSKRYKNLKMILTSDGGALTVTHKNQGNKDTKIIIKPFHSNSAFVLTAAKKSGTNYIRKKSLTEPTQNRFKKSTKPLIKSFKKIQEMKPGSKIRVTGFISKIHNRQGGYAIIEMTEKRINGKRINEESREPSFTIYVDAKVNRYLQKTWQTIKPGDQVHAHIEVDLYKGQKQGILKHSSHIKKQNHQ